MMAGEKTSARAILSQLGVYVGAPFSKALRTRVNLMINAQTPKAIILAKIKYTREWRDYRRAGMSKQERQVYDFNIDHYPEGEAQGIFEMLKREKRERRLAKLKACKTREERLQCFGVIESVDWQSIQPFNRWLRQQVNRLKRNAILREQGRFWRIRLDERNRQNEIDEQRAEAAKLRQDEDLTLKELMVKYVPGARCGDFAYYARMNADKAPFDVLVGFLGYDPRPEEQHPVPIAEVMPEAANELPAPTVAEVEALPVEPAKREGKQTQIKTRPDQLTFAQSVEHNCFDTCVVTGSRMHVRCSAAHLIEHKDGGADYYTNGLWMRWDIHKLFDDGWCAIDPATMTIWFLAEAIALDADLAAYQGKALAPTRKPINTDNLKHRWLAFKTLDKAAE